MKLTGSLWMKQELIQYLTKKFTDPSTLNNTDPVVEVNDLDLNHDHEPETDQPSHEPDGYAKKISQHACEQ